MPSKINADTRSRPVPDTAAEVPAGMRIKDDDIVSADETWYVGHIVDDIKPQTEPSNLVHSRQLGSTSTKPGDVVEVNVRKHGVVVHPQCWPLTFLHAFV
jgi:hypothetical protein